jgi:hypothetical protein
MAGFLFENSGSRLRFSIVRPHKSPVADAKRPVDDALVRHQYGKGSSNLLKLATVVHRGWGFQPQRTCNVGWMPPSRERLTG